MYFESKQFNAMTSSLDALAMQQRAILHNLANYETPGYKAREVAFEDVLKSAQQKTGGGRYDFKARVFQDDSTSVRPDGNNVNADVESIKLYENYTQSAYLFQKVSGQFNNIRNVLANGPK